MNTILSQCLWHQKMHMMGYFSKPSLTECHLLLPSKQKESKEIGQRWANFNKCRFKSFKQRYLWNNFSRTEWVEAGAALYLQWKKMATKKAHWGLLLTLPTCCVSPWATPNNSTFSFNSSNTQHLVVLGSFNFFPPWVYLCLVFPASSKLCMSWTYPPIFHPLWAFCKYSAKSQPHLYTPGSGPLLHGVYLRAEHFIHVGGRQQRERTSYHWHQMLAYVSLKQCRFIWIALQIHQHIPSLVFKANHLEKERDLD